MKSKMLVAHTEPVLVEDSYDWRVRAVRCGLCFAGLHFLRHMLVIDGLSLKSLGTTQLICLGIIEVQTIVS